MPAAASASAAQSTQPKPLPEIESLTPESDFAPFMSPGVGDDMRQKALKALFRDPHFSTVDMMDVYMEDFSLADPLPAGWLEKMEQVSHIGDRGGRDAEEAARRLAREKEGAGPGDGEVAAREDVADTSPGTERIDSPEPQPTVAGSASGDPPDADPDRQPSP